MGKIFKDDFKFFINLPEDMKLQDFKQIYAEKIEPLYPISFVCDHCHQIAFQENYCEDSLRCDMCEALADFQEYPEDEFNIRRIHEFEFMRKELDLQDFDGDIGDDLKDFLRKKPGKLISVKELARVKYLYLKLVKKRMGKEA